jgi:hypothetical protein
VCLKVEASPFSAPCTQFRAASIDPTITIGNPTAIPSVSGSPRNITPKTIATSGLT